MGRPKLSYKDLNIHGKKYGYLTVIGDGGRNNKQDDPCVIVQCECGKTKTVRLANLRYGLTISCGCYANKRRLEGTFKHGLCDHQLYSVWHSIKSRCEDGNNISYPNYGGRGVKVCKEWQSNFASFYNWAISNGWKPGLYIDKDIKGNGLLYSPKNCLVVTYEENNKHKRNTRYFTINGELKTLKEWCNIYNASHRLTYIRVHERKWDIARALTEKRHKYNAPVLAITKKKKTEFHSIADASRKLKIKKDTISNAIKNGNIISKGVGVGYKFEYV